MRIVILTGWLLAQAVFAQVWLEERTFVKDGQVTTRIDGLITKSFNQKFGGFTWFQVQKGYSEAYGGITYSPKPWLQLAVGPGIEEAESPARVGGFVWLGKGKSSVLFVPEYGGSGFWWKLEANHEIGKVFGVGFLTERFKGSGPRFEVNVPRTPLKLWAAPLFEKTRANLLVGIRWTL